MSLCIRLKSDGSKATQYCLMLYTLGKLETFPAFTEKMGRKDMGKEGDTAK